MKFEHPRPRRGPALGVEDPAPGATAGRVGEDRPEAAHVERRRVGDLDRAGQAEGVEPRRPLRMANAGHLPPLVINPRREGRDEPRVAGGHLLVVAHVIESAELQRWGTR